MPALVAFVAAIAADDEQGIDTGAQESVMKPFGAGTLPGTFAAVELC